MDIITDTLMDITFSIKDNICAFFVDKLCILWTINASLTHKLSDIGFKKFLMTFLANLKKCLYVSLKLMQYS